MVTNSDGKWVSAGPTTLIPVGEIFPVEVEGQSIIILKMLTWTRCFKNLCTHQNLPFSKFGQIVGNRLICNAHGACFDLPSGQAKTSLVKEAITTYSWRQFGENFEIFLPSISP